MKSTDPDGRRVRWIPRQADPPGDGRTWDLRGLPPPPLLPRPAANIFDLIPLVNAMRAALIAAGLAREEEEE